MSEARLKKLKQIKKEIGLNKMTPTQRKELRQLSRLYPVNPGSKFVKKKDKDIKPPVKNKKKLTSTSVRKPDQKLKQVNINPPRANTSSATSVRKPDQKLKQPKINNKSKEKIKKSTDDGRPFVKKLRSRIRKDQLAKIPKPPVKNKKVSNKKNEVSPTEQRRRQRMADIVPSMRRKKAELTKKREQKLASSFPQGTGETVERKKDIRKSPGHPSIRAKAPVVKKKVIKKKVEPVVKKKVIKKKVEPVVKKNVPDYTPSRSIPKSGPKSKVTAAEQKAADSFPQGMGRSLSKQEKAFADSRGGIKKFAPGKIEKGLATLGGGKMRGAVTALEDSYYSDIKDRMSKEGGEVSEYEKNYVKNFNTITNRKAKGGMVKRNMGGPAKPRKKTVFRRGGGQALRGFGKATYSNKMY